MKIKSIFLGVWLFLFIQHVYAEVISIETMSEHNKSIRDDDVKFILESSLGDAEWEPGVSKVAATGKNLLDYDTKGLKYYAIEGKINIFDSDVVEIEKYGTFATGDEQKELLKRKNYDKNSALEGMNISIRAFLLLKYFYFNSYDFLDGIAYEYDYYNFYARATNNVDAISWWGKTNAGNEGNDYVKLPAGSSLELTTEFREHRLYLADFKQFVRRFFIDSLQVGYFSTHWVRESFTGITSDDGQLPVIHTVLLESEGISFLLKHKFERFNVGLKIRYNYGLNNHVIFSHGSFDADYQGIDGQVEYQYDIYSTATYTIFTKLNLAYSAKWFDNTKYTLDSERVASAAISLGVVF